MGNSVRDRVRAKRRPQRRGKEVRVPDGGAQTQSPQSGRYPWRPGIRSQGRHKQVVPQHPEATRMYQGPTGDQERPKPTVSHSFANRSLGFKVYSAEASFLPRRSWGKEEQETRPYWDSYNKIRSKRELTSHSHPVH